MENYPNCISQFPQQERSLWTREWSKKRKYKANIHSIFLSYASNCQHIPNNSFPTNIVFSIYDSEMRFSYNSSSDVFVWMTRWEENTQEELGYWEKCLRDFPSASHFCFLSTSCPEGHECITGTCDSPTYSVTLQHTHTFILYMHTHTWSYAWTHIHRPQAKLAC